jgi:hypothetical protein
MTQRAFSITEMMDGPDLLGPAYAGDSWNTWRAVLKATFAEPLSEIELTAFKEVAGDREPPAKRVREAIFAVGRGGGKDAVASLMATAAAVNFDDNSKLRPGERATILCLALDKDQASIVKRYIEANFNETPALRSMVKSVTNDSIVLTNKVEIIVAPNNYLSVGGRSLLCVIGDECAMWYGENSSRPDVETIAAVRPGLARVPGSMLILISSVFKRSGLLYQKIRDHYGRNDDAHLAVLGTTFQFNPLADRAEIERDLAKDYPRYAAEYLSVWRDDLSSFIGRELLESLVDHGVLVRPPQRGIDGRHHFGRVGDIDR